MLAAEGCAALAYRLTGDPPVNRLCVKHLDGNRRVIVAFENTKRAWILLIGVHDSDSSANVYDELYEAGIARTSSLADWLVAVPLSALPSAVCASPAPCEHVTRPVGGSTAGSGRDPQLDVPSGVRAIQHPTR